MLIMLLPLLLIQYTVLLITVHMTADNSSEWMDTLKDLLVITVLWMDVRNVSTILI